jgi:hypothetical protein
MNCCVCADNEIEIRRVYSAEDFGVGFMQELPEQ